VQTNRRQNAGRAAIAIKLGARRSRHELGRRHRRGLAENVTGLDLSLIRRTPEVARGALAVILPLVLVARPLGAATGMVAAGIWAIVLAVHKPNRTMRLATGMQVMRAAPQHRMGEQHDSGQVGQENAQDKTSTPYRWIMDLRYSAEIRQLGHRKK
jgi:hypothetical protein